MKINSVCMIGMGFIGTTFAAVLAEAGFLVYGVEKDKEKLEKLKEGKPHFYEKGLPEILANQLGKNLHIFNEIPSDKQIDVFVVAVATPVDKVTKKPNLEYVKSAINDIIPHLKGEQLVILRSTVPVGATRNVVLPMLDGKNVYLSFCPERTVEGKAIEELKTLPQIIGALDEKSLDMAVELFSKITPSIVKTTSLEAAEIVKLVNNSYRDFTFAYANQIGLICKNIGLDAKEVIEAANFGYSRSNVQQPGFVGGLKPGFVGGVCLEKDPDILIDSSGLDGGMVKAAREINEGLIPHVFESIKNYLKENNKTIEEAKILISGLAFKGQPATDDLRGSPALTLIELLKRNNAKRIFSHDFVVKESQIKDLGITFCSLDEVKDADVVVFMNNHKDYQNFDISKVKPNSLVFDGWQLF